MRGRRRNKVLAAALVGSALLHLSAITVFRIVIYFPREYVAYVDFEIVQAAAPPVEAPAGESVPWIPGYGDGLADTLLPPIELPTLEFAELERLRVRHEGLISEALRTDVFGEENDDSWRRFGEALGQIRHTLTGLSLSGAGAPALPTFDERQPAPTLRPAEGFQAFIEWDTDPKDRQLLFAPPIQALWELDESKVRLPISLVLEVSALGRVVNVWSPTLDPTGVIDNVQLGVLKYRFEPLEDPSASNQLGTLQISRAEGDT